MKRMKYVLMGGLVAGAAALTVTGVATADSPTGGDHPLLSTTCSFDQVYAAIKADNPKAATQLDKHQKAEDRLKKVLAMTPQERQQKYDQFKDKHPKAADRLANGPKHEKARAVLNKALESCGSH